MTRVFVRSLLVLILLAVTGLIGWRVLAPAEVLDPATGAYPNVSVRGPGVTGRTASAPLIVDGRIRAYAARRLVKADAPVSARTMYTPRWSYRRWPQQISGVVAVGRTVISRWSDGKLVAIDGRTGRIAWRAGGPSPDGGPATGSATVWAPPGMVTADSTVLVRGAGQIIALDAATGAVRWQGACPGESFTTAGGQVVCGDLVRDAAGGQPAPGSWPAGPYTPVGCAVARSDCLGMRDAAGEGWLTRDPTPVRALGLTAPDTTVLGADRPLALRTEGDRIIASAPRTGGELWHWSAPGGAIVLGAGPGWVYLLTADRRLVTLDAATGETRMAFPLAVGIESTDWHPGRWQVTGGYLAVERLAQDGGPFTVEPVVIAKVSAPT